MIYPDINLVMNSIIILNYNEISLNFRLTYFITYKGKGKVIPSQAQCGPEGG